MIIEGCYIPFSWQEDFIPKYLQYIKYICLIFSEQYIKNNFVCILNHENVIEKRLPTALTIEELCKTNKYNLNQCKFHNYKYILIDSAYQIDIDKL